MFGLPKSASPCALCSLSPPLYSTLAPRLVSLSPPIAPLHLHLTVPPCTVASLASPSTTIPSLVALAPTAFSPVNQDPQNPHLPNSTMAKREPCSIHMSRDWSNLPSDILDLRCTCMDMLSALRLAACSRARTQPSLKRGLSFSRHPACCYLVLRDFLTMIQRRT